MSAASGRRDRSSRRGSHALAPLLAVRWMRRRVPSEPPPACPSDWGRRSSLPPPYSSCPSASSSTAIPLSGWMNYASFLVTIMGLLIPWSCTLAMFDIYSAFSGCSLRLPGLMVIVVVGDMVLSILSLAAASASAGVIDLLLHIDGNYCPPKFCGRYQLSTAMAFLAWFLSAASCLFNLWLVASW